MLCLRRTVFPLIFQRQTRKKRLFPCDGVVSFFLFLVLYSCKNEKPEKFKVYFLQKHGNNEGYVVFLFPERQNSSLVFFFLLWLGFYE